MKKMFFLIMATLFSVACDKEEEVEKENMPNISSVNLITIDDPTFFTKTVILFEDNDYLIKTNFDTYINSYPFDVLQGYDEIKQQANQDSNIQDVLLTTDYLSGYHDNRYKLAFHLQDGSCLIYHKKRNVIISKIEVETYMEGGPMMATGGRKFYIEGVLFLETIDMIS